MRQDLKNRILDLLKPNDLTDVEILCQDVHEYQKASVESYREILRRISPQRVDDSILHYIPTTFFKTFKLTSLHESKIQYSFHTSGTSLHETGRHFYGEMDLYDRSILQSFSSFFTKEIPKTWVTLTPLFERNPHSSLGYMLHVLLKAYANQHFDAWKANTFSPLELGQFLLQQDLPVMIATTSVSFWDFLLDLQTRNQRIPLHPDSMIFETGGSKGRRDIPPTSTRIEVALDHLNLQPNQYFGEYGMTEMSTPSWGCFTDGKILYQPPHWLKTEMIHPSSLKEVQIGEEGLLRVFDLCNLDSVSALYTGDWCRKWETGFEVLGRAFDEEHRGCSTISPLPLFKVTASKQNKIPSTRRQNHSKDLRVSILATLAEKWRNRNHPSRKKFEMGIIRQGYWSPEILREGLDRTFEAIHSETLKRAISDEKPTQEKRPKSLWIPAGNLPITGVFGFFTALLSGGESLHRISRRGGELLVYLYNDLRSLDPKLCESLQILSFSSAQSDELLQCIRWADLVLAQGDARTEVEFRKLCNENQKRLLYYGPGFSASLVSNLSEEECTSLAKEIFLWEQQGCLNPQIIFYLGRSMDEKNLIHRFLESARKASDIYERRPRSRDIGDRYLRSTWARGLSNQSKCFATSPLYVLHLPSPREELFSTPGLVQWISVDSPNKVRSNILGFKARLQSIAISNSISSEEENELRSFLSFERVCKLGELQSPPFSFSQDGLNRFPFLTHLNLS